MQKEITIKLNVRVIMSIEMSEHMSDWMPVQENQHVHMPGWVTVDGDHPPQQLAFAPWHLIAGATATWQWQCAMISRNQSGGSKPASNKISVGKNMRTSTTKARYNQQKPTSIAQEKKGIVFVWRRPFLGSMMICVSVSHHIPRAANITTQQNGEHVNMVRRPWRSNTRNKL